MKLTVTMTYSQCVTNNAIDRLTESHRLKVLNGSCFLSW